jgi:acetylglutamate synthase
LKQTDYDGKSFYSPIVSFDNTLKIKEISSKVNLLGVEVNEYYKGVVIITYDDGSIEKTMQ